MSKNSTYPSRLADQFVVRLPDGMRDRIAEAAELNVRSMNAEIVARLEMTFDAMGKITPGEMIEALMKAFPPGMIEIRIGKVDSPDVALVRAQSEFDKPE